MGEEGGGAAGNHRGGSGGSDGGGTPPPSPAGGRLPACERRGAAPAEASRCGVPEGGVLPRPAPTPWAGARRLLPPPPAAALRGDRPQRGPGRPDPGEP